MYWDELKEKAKELGYEYGIYKTLKDSYAREFLKIRLDFNEYLVFWAVGKIQIVYVGGCEITISSHRTPEQMFMIMEALK